MSISTGTNLNDSTYSTHGRFNDQLLDVVDYGASFILGVRFETVIPILPLTE